MPVTISHAKSNTIPDWSGVATVGNSTGGTTTVQGSDLVRPSDWNSNHQATMAVVASEIGGLFAFNNGLSSSTNTNGITAGFDYLDFYEPWSIHTSGTSSQSFGNASWFIDGPYRIDGALSQGQINFLMACGNAFLGGNVYSAANTGSVTKYATISEYLCLYSAGSGASSSRLNSVYSGSIEFRATQNLAVTSTASDQVAVTHAVTVSFPSQYDSVGGVTYGTTSQSGSSSTQSTTMASTRVDSFVNTAGAYFTGSRMDAIGLTTTLPPGVYWLGRMINSTSSTTGTNYGAGTVFPVQSNIIQQEISGSAYKRAGASTTLTSTNFLPFHGVFQTTSASAPATIGSSDYRNSFGKAYWNVFQTSW